MAGWMGPPPVPSPAGQDLSFRHQRFAGMYGFLFRRARNLHLTSAEPTKNLCQLKELQ